MAEPPSEFRAAGDLVEVVDFAHKLRGRIGTISFFVGDNVYVTFDDRRPRRTKMFFPDQLRLASSVAPQRRSAQTGWTRRLKTSLAKMRLFPRLRA